MAAPEIRGTLWEVLAAGAAERADATALVFGGRSMTYGQLQTCVEAAAHRVQHAWGLRAGDRVAWLGANHPAQLVLLFALARCGAILLPLNFRLAPAEWDTLLRDARPAFVVHDAAWREAAAALAQRHSLATHEADEVMTAGAPAWDAAQQGASDSPVLLVYTSGTTGRPKGALHTQANLVANMRIAAQVQEIGPADRIATVLPMFHVGGLCIQTLPALAAGATVLLHERFTPEASFDCFERDRPTLTLQVPATMKALVDHPRWAGADLSSLRAVWAGSSVLPAPLVQAFHARGVPVCNVYGATETGPFSIALPPAKAFARVGSCGWPAPGVEARLADVQRGAGEVLLRGPNVVARYWPDLAACDVEGWFHTGDLASQDADGAFTIVGRAKELIISGGENIHPAEVEAAAAEHPAVMECAAFALPDPQWGEIVALAVVRREGGALDEDELRAHIAARLARYKLPRRWFWVEALPKTALGKVQRQELAARLRGA